MTRLETLATQATTKHTIVLFVEQCINENNILYEGGVYVRKPSLALLSYWGDLLILYGLHVFLSFLDQHDDATVD